MPETSPHVQQLTEHIEDWRSADLVVDRTRRRVRNVALTAAESRNGYRYSEQALREAVSLYENKPVFLDHAANVSRPFDRSTRDLVGTIADPRYEAGRIRADIHTIDTESGRTFVALAESANPAVGMSHVVLAERGRDRSLVEKIHDVVSVDAVVFPATASTFQESLQNGRGGIPPGSLEAVLLAVDGQLAAHVRNLRGEPECTVKRIGLFPEQVLLEVRTGGESPPSRWTLPWRMDDGEVLLGEQLQPVNPQENGDSLQPTAWQRAKVEQLQGEVDRLRGERDQLQRQLDEYDRRAAAAERESEIEKLLKESRLPQHAVTRLFREQLLAAPDAAARRALIAERRELLGRLAVVPPTSGERAAGANARLSNAAFASIIRGKRRG